MRSLWDDLSTAQGLSFQFQNSTSSLRKREIHRKTLVKNKLHSKITILLNYSCSQKHYLKLIQHFVTYSRENFFTISNTYIIQSQRQLDVSLFCFSFLSLSLILYIFSSSYLCPPSFPPYTLFCSDMLKLRLPAEVNQ